MSGYYLLKNGEFAYNKSYSVGYDFGSIKRLDRYPMGALSTLYICFALTQHNSDFMKVYFDSLKWYKEIYMIAAEGARNHGLLNVPTDDFFDTIHILPQNPNEQDKIAKFLILIEKRIEKQRQFVEALKSYKRGALDHFFSKKSIGYETAKLGELCAITTGKLDANASDENGQYPFFTCSKTALRINSFAFDTEAILIAGNGDIGHTKYYRGKFNAYQRTYVLTDFALNVHYVQAAIDTFLPKRIAEETQGGAMPYIKLSTLSELSLPIISEQQQEKMCVILNFINKQCEIAERILALLNECKIGLLQHLFI